MSNAAVRQRTRRIAAGSADPAVQTSWPSLARGISVELQQGSQTAVSWRMREGWKEVVTKRVASLWRRSAVQGRREMVQEVEADAGAKMGFKDKMGLGGDSACGSHCPLHGGRSPPHLCSQPFSRLCSSTSRDGPVFLCIQVHLCTIPMPLDILPLPRPG